MLLEKLILSKLISHFSIGVDPDLHRPWSVALLKRLLQAVVFLLSLFHLLPITCCVMNH
jgi:hypothetical protein